MARIGATSNVLLERGQPLIAVISRCGDQEVVRYVTSEAEARASVTQEAIQTALNLPGAWSDMDWGDMEANLHEIRRANPPTPPISLDE